MFRLNARQPVNSVMILSTSAAVRARSPDSGAVVSKASLSSALSTWPLSSSSKAEKADSSSVLGESAARTSDSEFKKAASAVDCGPDEGKNRATSEGPFGKPWTGTC